MKLYISDPAGIKLTVSDLVTGLRPLPDGGVSVNVKTLCAVITFVTDPLNPPPETPGPVSTPVHPAPFVTFHTTVTESPECTRMEPGSWIWRSITGFPIAVYCTTTFVVCPEVTANAGNEHTPEAQLGVVGNVDTVHSVPPVTYAQVPTCSVYPPASVKEALCVPLVESDEKVAGLLPLGVPSTYAAVPLNRLSAASTRLIMISPVVAPTYRTAIFVVCPAVTVTGVEHMPAPQVGVVGKLETVHSVPPVANWQVPSVSVYPERSPKYAVWAPCDRLLKVEGFTVVDPAVLST